MGIMGFSGESDDGYGWDDPAHQEVRRLNPEAAALADRLYGVLRHHAYADHHLAAIRDWDLQCRADRPEALYRGLYPAAVPFQVVRSWMEAKVVALAPPPDGWWPRPEMAGQARLAMLDLIRANP